MTSLRQRGRALPPNRQRWLLLVATLLGALFGVLVSPHLPPVVNWVVGVLAVAIIVEGIVDAVRVSRRG